MDISPYAVGALLYAPAIQDNLVRQVQEERLDAPVLARALSGGQHQRPGGARGRGMRRADARPRSGAHGWRFTGRCSFFGVRAPGQIPRLWARMGAGRTVLTGFIAPNFP